MEKVAQDYSYDRRRSTCAQVLASVALHTLNMGVGMVVASPVFIIGALRQSAPGQDLHFTEEQASWFGGIPFVVQPLGSLVSGVIQETVSRRSALMAVNLPLLVAWLVMYFATTPTELFIGMALLGLSIGFMEAPVLAYIGEIAEPHLRGVLSSLGAVVFNTGVIVTTAVGAATSWRTMVLFNTLGPLVSFTAMALVPDSPAWLVSKGRVPAAQKSYQWLRGWTTPKAVLQEVTHMVNYVQARRASVPAVDTEGQTKVKAKEASKLEVFLHPSIQRPLRLIVIYFIISVCATLNGMKMFLVEELESIRIPITTDSFLVWGGVSTFLGAITATVSLRYLGKRTLTFLSLGLSVFCCLGLGLYLALDLQCPPVPLVLILLSNFAATLGIIFIPWVLISELFPLKGRSMASGFAAATFYVFVFLVIKTYYTLKLWTGPAGPSLLYGAVGVAGFVYLYRHLPETEGVTLVDIEAMFVNNGPAITVPAGQTPSDREVNTSVTSTALRTTA